MTMWLSVAWMASIVNLGLLLILGTIWLRAYRNHGARHTLALLIFAGLLLVQNGIWAYFYGIHPAFIAWFTNSTSDIQFGLVLLCGLETIALLVLTWITWQ